MIPFLHQHLMSHRSRLSFTADELAFAYRQAGGSATPEAVAEACGELVREGKARAEEGGWVGLEREAQRSLFE